MDLVDDYIFSEERTAEELRQYILLQRDCLRKLHQRVAELELAAVAEKERPSTGSRNECLPPRSSASSSPVATTNAINTSSPHIGPVSPGDEGGRPEERRTWHEPSPWYRVGLAAPSPSSSTSAEAKVERKNSVPPPSSSREEEQRRSTASAPLDCPYYVPPSEELLQHFLRGDDYLQ